MNKKVRVVIEGTYELLPEYYKGCTTPEEMIAMDRDNENVGIEGLIESLGDTVTIKFELVKE